jgi:hypothetical protein
MIIFILNIYNTYISFIWYILIKICIIYVLFQSYSWFSDNLLLSLSYSIQYVIHSCYGCT